MGIFATIASDPIQRPSDPVTEGMVEHMSLERMTTINLVIFTAGATYATWLVIQWANTGFTHLPMATGDVLAFTAIVIGLQTVFNAFFLSTVGGMK